MGEKEELAVELDRLIEAGLDGNALAASDLRDFLWSNKVGLLRYIQAACAIEDDLVATLKSVLFHFGPGGANKVTRDVLLARKSRQTNAEIDALEQLFCQNDDALPDDATKARGE